MLLRALLPTLTELNDDFSWDPAYEACFLDARPPCRRVCHLAIDYDAPADGTSGLPSVDVLEAMPAVEELTYSTFRRQVAAPHMPDIQPLVTAFNRGVAFQQLHTLKLSRCTLASFEWDLVLNALGGAGCAA